MTLKEIIDGLKFTVDVFLLDPNTGEAYEEPRNDMDKTIIDACKGAIELLSNLENQNKWIPFKTRPMTEEEITYHRDWAECGAKILDCPLPDDGQEVLVSFGGKVSTDTFVKDNLNYYFKKVEIDNNIDAWMPMPKPYKIESEEV